MPGQKLVMNNSPAYVPILVIGRTANHKEEQKKNPFKVPAQLHDSIDYSARRLMLADHINQDSGRARETMLHSQDLSRRRDSMAPSSPPSKGQRKSLSPSAKVFAGLKTKLVKEPNTIKKSHHKKDGAGSRLTQI